MQVLIDADVAEVYGLETKRINEAVKNNPDRFHLRTVSLRLPLPGNKATPKVVIYPGNENFPLPKGKINKKLVKMLDSIFYWLRMFNI